MFITGNNNRVSTRNRLILHGNNKKHSDFKNVEKGKDDLFNDAISLVITHQQGSISLLQRRMKIGYSRAARLIDEMEKVGIVGPFTGSKAREVLVDETYLEIIRD